MWFKRKPKNRRTGRKHVLDVKLRSDQVRASRVRVAALACGVAPAGCLAPLAAADPPRAAAIDDAVGRLGQTVLAMQESARLVAASTADQHDRIELVARQAESSSLGVDAIARHAALVEGLAGEAALLATQTDDRVQAALGRAQELERSIAGFLGEIAQVRAERNGAVIRDAG